MDQTQNNPGGGPQQQTAPGFLKQVENWLFGLYQKVPWHLPAKAREFIVHFGPWITLVIMVLSVPALLLALGVTAVFAPVAVMYGARIGGSFFLGGLVSLLAFLLAVIALPGLFKRELKAWQLVYYSVLVSAVADVLMVNLGGFIIGTALSLYVLFEIKSYYK